MLIVTIHLAPQGDIGRLRHLGTALIIHDGSGTSECGSYDVVLSKLGRNRSLWRKGRVEGFPRKKLGPYDLLLRALLATVGGRNLSAVRLLDRPRRPKLHVVGGQDG
jgi:hypothetical protein